MSKRALLIALVVSILGAVLMLLYVQRFEQQMSGGDRVELIVAIKPIPRGSVITKELLAVREVPLAYVEDRAVKAAERDKVVGLRVGNTVQAQETLMWTDLEITADERRDLSSLVQPGNRAVSVHASHGDKSFALIRPGDYVDVIAVLPDPKDTKKSTSVVLLQRVLVLSVGLETTPERFKDKQHQNRMANRDMLISLSLRLPEAQLLSLAGEKGRFSVVLRNPEDQRIIQKIPDMPSSSLMNTVERAKAQKGRTGPIRLETGGTR